MTTAAAAGGAPAPTFKTLASFNCSSGFLFWGQIDCVLEAMLNYKDKAFDGKKKPHVNNQGPGVYTAAFQFKCEALKGKWSAYEANVVCKYSEDRKQARRQRWPHISDDDDARDGHRGDPHEGEPFDNIVFCHESSTLKYIFGRAKTVCFSRNPDLDADVIFVNRYDWSCGGPASYEEWWPGWKARGHDVILVDSGWKPKTLPDKFRRKREREEAEVRWELREKRKEVKRKEKAELKKVEREKNGNDVQPTKKKKVEKLSDDDEDDDKDDDDDDELLEEEEESDVELTSESEEENEEDLYASEEEQYDENGDFIPDAPRTQVVLDKLEAKYKEDKKSKCTKLLDDKNEVCGLLCQAMAKKDWICARLVFDTDRKLIGFCVSEHGDAWAGLEDLEKMMDDQ